MTLQRSDSSFARILGAPVRLPRRFRLRTLLVVIAVLSVPLGLFSSEMLRLRHQRFVASRISVGGTSFIYDLDYQPDGGTTVREPSAITSFLRRKFGDDVFADVSHVQWNYSYRLIDGDAIELVAGLPGLRQVSFVGAPVTNGRPPLPGDKTISGDQVEYFLDRQLAGFGRFAGCKQLTRMVLFGGFPTDQHLKRLVDGGNLESLEVLFASNVSDDGVSAIGTYRRLERLRIAEAPLVTDVGAAQLGKLTSLKLLDLSGTAVTDRALSHLEQLSNLESLSLDRCAITDAGALSLAKLKRLKKLVLASTGIGDDGLAELGSLRDLKELDLTGTQVTDAGLDALQNLSHLDKLSLAGTSVTDAGLMKLASNVALRNVHVTVPQNVSREGVRQLKACLPHCLFECSSYDARKRRMVLEAWE